MARLSFPRDLAAARGIDLYDYTPARPAPPRRRAGRPRTEAFRVVDDWGEVIPLRAAELDVLEGKLASVLDDLFGASLG